jgi:hypothetical protein
MVRPRVETSGFQILPSSLNIIQCLAIEMWPLFTVTLIFFCNLKSDKDKWPRNYCCLVARRASGPMLIHSTKNLQNHKLLT